MTVEFAKEPARCRDALEEGLKNLGAVPTPAALGHLAAVTNAEAPPPLPVYIVTLDELIAGRPQTNGHVVAWEYLLVTGGQTVRTAEIHLDRTDPQKGFTFAAISTGAATGLANAISVVERDPGIAAGRYEMRLVRVPALYVTALWLKDLNDAVDLYVVIPPAPEGFQAHSIIQSLDLFKLLQIKAIEKAQVSPSPPSQPTIGSPSN
jgi:hypothetical protein